MASKSKAPLFGQLGAVVLRCLKLPRAVREQGPQLPDPAHPEMLPENEFAFESKESNEGCKQTKLGI